MKILGLTGGSGTGKGTASAAFAALGCGIVDADACYRVLCDTCQPMLNEIQSVFSDVLLPDGKLNRKKLGTIVFADPDKLLQLNAVTHPYIRQAITNAFAAYEQAGCALCILDAPVLFEAKMDSLCDSTCAVLADREIRISRIMARDDIPEQYAAMRVDAQKKQGFYREKCDYIIQNDADLDNLYLQVRQIYHDMLRKE